MGNASIFNHVILVITLQILAKNCIDKKGETMNNNNVYNILM